MPSPGISLGDLAVFVAVVMVVAVFLMAVRSAIQRAETPDQPAAPQRGKREARPIARTGPPPSPDIASSGSATLSSS